MKDKRNLDQFIEEQIRQKPILREELEKATRAVDIAMQIFNLRKKRGLTQIQLARMIGINQSNIARIESADYTSYSLKTLTKVAKGLNANLNIILTPTNDQSVYLTAIFQNVSPVVYKLDGNDCYIYFYGTFSLNDRTVIKPLFSSEKENISILNSKLESEVKDYYYSVL